LETHAQTPAPIPPIKTTPAIAMSAVFDFALAVIGLSGGTCRSSLRIGALRVPSNGSPLICAPNSAGFTSSLGSVALIAEATTTG
jgi:hypothetical protein